MPHINNIPWAYDGFTARQDKSTSRTGTKPGFAADLTGVDGAKDGALRPVPGFLNVVDFQYGSGVGAFAGGILDRVFGITLRVSDTVFAYGFLYRVLNNARTTASYRFYYRISGGKDDGTWKHDAMFGFDAGLIPPETFSNELMTVALGGRYAYILRSGKPIFAIRVEEVAGTPFNSYPVRVFDDLGPGPTPNLTDDYNLNTACARTRTDSGNTLPGKVHPDLVETLTVPVIPTDGTEAAARLAFFGFSNVTTSVFTNLDPTTRQNPRIAQRNLASTPDSPWAEPIRGISDLRWGNNTPVYTTAPAPNPTFTDLINTRINGITQPPAFNRPEPYGSNNGALYLHTVRKAKEKEPVAVAGTQTYVYAYRLVDSRSGRIGRLSNRVTTLASLFAPAVKYGGTTYAGGDFSKATDNYLPVVFPALHIVYKFAKWDTIMLYRGVATGDLTAEQTVLSLDAVLPLADFTTSAAGQPTGADALTWKRAIVWFQTTDGDITFSPKFADDRDGTFMESPPQGGVGYVNELTFYIGGFRSLNTAQLGAASGENDGLPVIRWSSPLARSLESFAENSRYNLQTPSEDIVAIAKAGPNLIAFSTRANYFMRRETTSVKGFPLHVGYGTFNPLSVCEVGSEIYFVTAKGIKSIDSTAALSDVRTLDGLVVGSDAPWRPHIDKIQLTYDEEAAALFVFNPVLRQCAVLWFNTSRVTMLEDCCFETVCQGEYTDTSGMVAVDNPVRRRAFFLATAQTNTGLPFWRLYYWDYKHRKTNFIYMDSDASTYRHTLSAPYTNPANTITVPFNYPGGTTLQNHYLYVLDGPNAGAKSRILFAPATTVSPPSTVLRLETPLPSLPVGTRVGISPVYFRWITGRVQIQDANGNRFSNDLMIVRTVSDIAVYFTDVTGPAAGSTDARWRGLVYTANSPLPSAKAFPRDITGTGLEAFCSLKDGPSDISASVPFSGPMLFPGVEIFIPEVRYDLLQITATGSVTQSLREERPLIRKP